MPYILPEDVTAPQERLSAIYRSWRKFAGLFLKNYPPAII